MMTLGGSRGVSHIDLTFGGSHAGPGRGDDFLKLGRHRNKESITVRSVAPNFGMTILELPYNLCENPDTSKGGLYGAPRWVSDSNEGTHSSAIFL